MSGNKKSIGQLQQEIADKVAEIETMFAKTKSLLIEIKALSTDADAAFLPLKDREPKRSNSNSGYKGVYYDRWLGKYTAKAKAKHLGVYDTAIEAAEARQKALALLGVYE